MSVLDEESPVQKRGQKGRTLFYRASQALSATPINLNDARAVDVLAAGREAVIPPSQHPSTGRAYEWITEGTLENTAIGNLPILPDDIAERIRVALRPLGAVDDAKPVYAEREYDDDDLGGAAMRDFSAWVPHLGVPYLAQRGGNYRCAGVWRGGDGMNVSFHPGGIRDFRDNVGHSPVDIVQRARGLDYFDAANWLGERFGIPALPRVKITFRKAEPARERAPLDGAKWGEGITWEAAPRTVGELGEGDRLKPDGLIGDMVDWIMSQMQNPNRPLAVAAALATITPVVGWRNLYSPTGCALNGYFAGLVATAVGKDAMIKLPGKILATLQIPTKLYSNSDAFSLSAQESVVHRHPAILLALDEISTNMFPRMFGARASSHESGMKGLHMKLFARNIGDPDHGFTSRAPGAINQLDEARDPQYSMLAANTPKMFWQALPQSTITDGYLNRWVVFEAAPRETNKNLVIEDVPAAITEKLFAIANGGRAGVNRGLRQKGRQIPWASDDVRKAWEAIRDRLLPMIDSETTEGFLLGRTAEHAIRFATKHAIGCLGADKAVVRMEDLEWGAALALESARATAEGAKKMANSDHGRLAEELRGIIRKAKKITLSELTRATRNADPLQRRRALADLVDTEEVEVTESKHKTAKTTNIRWIGD